MSPPTLDVASIRRLLAATRLPDDPLDVDFERMRRRMPAEAVDSLRRKLRPAGVLIPIIERDPGLTVLLTERSAELKHHAGQVSFPGGGMEQADQDVAATALRETHEEVGIEPERIEVAGYLPSLPTITGYAVTPVVGLVAADFRLRIDPLEVESAFEVPLEYLLDAGNEVYSEREFEGVVYPITSIDFDGHRIWGATAIMIGILREQLSIRNR